MLVTPRVVTELRRSARTAAAPSGRVRAGAMTFRNGITPYAFGAPDFCRYGNGFATSGADRHIDPGRGRDPGAR
ncbi:hypothetical protein GCM10009566_03550 [Streptomyces murinus]